MYVCKSPKSRRATGRKDRAAEQTNSPVPLRWGLSYFFLDSRRLRPPPPPREDHPAMQVPAAFVCGIFVGC